MILKKIFAFLLAVAPLGATAMEVYYTDIAELPQGSGFEIVSHDENSGIWRLKVVENDGGALAPKIRLQAIPEPVPAGCTAFFFDYRTTQPCQSIEFTCYKLFMGNLTKSYEIEQPMIVSDSWQSIGYYVGRLRSASGIRFLNKAGQYQDLTFYDLPVGAELEIKGLRFQESVFPYKNVTISANQGAVVEAEDYDIALDGVSSHSTRYIPSVKQWEYRNPTGDQFPIYAWGSVDYNGALGAEAAVAEMKKQYQWLADCGFNYTLGTAWPGVDAAALFDGNEVNGFYVNFFEDLNLKMIIKSGLQGYNDCINRYNDCDHSPRLGGYHVFDEPHRKHFPEMLSRLAWLRSTGTDKLLYCNLLHIGTDMNAIEFESYDDYVNTYISQTGVGFLSWDYYPVRESVETGAQWVRPGWYQNFEVIAKLCKYWNVPMWSFAQGCGSHWNVAAENAFSPTPDEEALRMQVFTGLAYGSQCMQYYTYQQEWGDDIAPIDCSGNKTEVWYIVQRINQEIQAMKNVWLGGEMVRVGYTGVPPTGCISLRDDMLFPGIASVTTSGDDGVLVSMYQNGSSRYVMVLNPLLHTETVATVDITSDIKRVLPDGTFADQPKGVETYSLHTGDYILFLVDENADPIERSIAELPENTSYRDDENVIVAGEPTMSGGHYIPNMGDPSWQDYTLELTDSRVISREQAINNWGCSFTYTINVAEDMDADISVGHSVPWSDYGRVAAIGSEPGYYYTIEDDPALNWPKQYAASMVLSIDGIDIPTNQFSRPVAPDSFDPAGSAFDLILADKDSWTSTCDADGNPSTILYFWPQAGGNDDPSPIYRDEPDYRAVHLSAGLHKFTVTSLCYPWNFDSLRILPSEDSGVGHIAMDAAKFSAHGGNGAVVVESNQPFTIYTLGGVTVASCHPSNFTTHIPMAPGIYLVAAADGSTAKVVVK